jgi:REP element-mobilizing transposase RayT
LFPNGPRRPAKRKHIRLSAEVYGDPGAVFLITICTAQRRALFGTPKLARVIFDALISGRLFTEANCQAICLMPDHVHLVISPKDVNLVTLINAWKSYTTHLLHQLGVSGSIWQRSFYDHALRTEESTRSAAQYVVENPVRKALVEDWMAYPYLWAYWMPGT